MRFRCFVLFLFSFGLYAHGDKDTQQPLEASTVTQKQDKGSEIYGRFCFSCHQEGIAGAPKVHHKEDWSKHKKSIQKLVDAAIKGINSMPPKGTCYECSEEDIKAAIQYMVPNND